MNVIGQRPHFREPTIRLNRVGGIARLAVLRRILGADSHYPEVVDVDVLVIVVGHAGCGHRVRRRTRRLFGNMLRLIAALPLLDG